MKNCAMCKRSLPPEEFHRNKARHDGLDTRCKACSKVRRRVVRNADPEASRAKEAAYRDAHREKFRVYFNRYAAKRRTTDEYRAYQRRYKAQWLKGEIGRAYNRAKRRRRRSLELAVPGFHTPEQLAGRVALYQGRCWRCGAPAVAIDHVKPLTKGGSDWPANLRPICHPCNSRKSDIWPFPHRPHFPSSRQ